MPRCDAMQAPARARATKKKAMPMLLEANLDVIGQQPTIGLRTQAPNSSTPDSIGTGICIHMCVLNTENKFKQESSQIKKNPSI